MNQDYSFSKLVHHGRKRSSATIILGQLRDQHWNTQTYLSKMSVMQTCRIRRRNESSTPHSRIGIFILMTRHETMCTWQSRHWRGRKPERRLGCSRLIPLLAGPLEQIWSLKLLLLRGAPLPPRPPQCCPPVRHLELRAACEGFTDRCVDTHCSDCRGILYKCGRYIVTVSVCSETKAKLINANRCIVFINAHIWCESDQGGYGRLGNPARILCACPIAPLWLISLPYIGWFLQQLISRQILERNPGF